MKELLGVKTRGFSKRKGLTLNKVLAQGKSKQLSIGIIQSVLQDKANEEVHRWSLREPEKSITVFFSVKERQTKVVVGECFQPYLDPEELDKQILIANSLLQDEQFLKGIEVLIKHISAKIA